MVCSTRCLISSSSSMEPYLDRYVWAERLSRAICQFTFNSPRFIHEESIQSEGFSGIARSERYLSSLPSGAGLFAAMQHRHGWNDALPNLQEDLESS
jgi:hypothetical protein